MAVSWRRGVRARTAAAATAIVALALGVGGVVIVEVHRSTLEDDLERYLQTRAESIEAIVASGTPIGSLELRREQEAFVQVIDADGLVRASSANVDGDPPQVELEPGFRNTTGISVDPDERYRVLVTPIDRGWLILAVSAESVEESLTALVRTLAVVIPCLVVVVAVTSWTMVGRALRPVESIRARVAAISDSELEVGVPEPATGDEIERLARTMNHMLARLGAAFARQERFVADASHELKSPLTAIRTQLEVDLEHPDTADPLATHRIVAAEVAELQQIVDDLLFLARTDSTVELPSAPVDLDDVVFAEIERRGATDGPDVDLGGVSAGQVVGDRVALTRLVRNLIDNAVRHATDRVDVTLSEADGRVVLVVADDGPGVPPAAATTIFERFARGDDARARDEDGGVGLGLAIARAVAVRHHGTLVLDQRDGTGARFVVDLPSSST